MGQPRDSSQLTSLPKAVRCSYSLCFHCRTANTAWHYNITGDGMK